MTASKETVEFLNAYYRLVDAMKIGEFMAFFTPDARLIFANNEPMQGRDAIEAGLTQVLSSVDGIRHDLRQIWNVDDDTVVFEVDVTYSRKDGRDVRVPGSAVCEMRNGLMAQQRIYVDLAPVFA